MGKRRISICLGSSCFARGNNANIAVVKQFLADRGLEAEVTFTGQLCENMCNRGPIICIDDQVYEEVNLSLLHKARIYRTGKLPGLLQMHPGVPSEGYQD